jgi:hypothetical protein
VHWHRPIELPAAASSWTRRAVRGGQGGRAGSIPQPKRVTEMGAAPIATIELPAVIFAPTSITCVAALRRRAKNGLGLGLTTVTLVEPLQVPPRYKRRARPGPLGHMPEPEDRWAHARSALVGLIPYPVKDTSGGRKPINAGAENVASLFSFRDAYPRCRCLLPIDNFFGGARSRARSPNSPTPLA